MEREELRAYGMITRLAELAIERKGGHVGEVELNKAKTIPGTYVAQLLVKAQRMNALTKKDEYMVSALFDSIDTAGGERITVEQQGDYLLGYYQYDNEMMGAEEAALELGVSKQRIYKLIDDRLLTGYKVRGKWRVGRRSVERRKIDLGSKGDEL